MGDDPSTQDLGDYRDTPIEALGLLLWRGLKDASWAGEWRPSDYSEVGAIAGHTGLVAAELVMNLLAHDQRLLAVLTEHGWTITPPSPCQHGQDKYVHGSRRCAECGRSLDP